MIQLTPSTKTYFFSSIFLLLFVACVLIVFNQSKFAIPMIIGAAVIYAVSCFVKTENKENFVSPQTLSLSDPDSIPIIIPEPIYAPEVYPVPATIGYDTHTLQDASVEYYTPASNDVSRRNQMESGIYDMLTPLNMIPSDEMFIRSNSDGTKKTAITNMFNKTLMNDLHKRADISKFYTNQINRNTSHDNSFDYINGYRS